MKKRTQRGVMWGMPEAKALIIIGDASETLDTYSHLWPTDEGRIRDAIDAGVAAHRLGAGGL